MSALLLSQLMRFSSGVMPWQTRPFSIKVKRIPWSIATDGYTIVAFKLPGASPALSSTPKDALAVLLSASTKGCVEIPTADLKAWAGSVPARAIAHGDVEAVDQGVLCGVAVDRRKLAYLLATVPFPSVSVWAHTLDMVGFEASGGIWRAFLAGLSGGIGDDENVFAISKPPGAPLSSEDMFEFVDKM